jgi:beta-phosphoglucomutase-like phosphatase (HAD superfamily)
MLITAVLFDFMGTTVIEKNPETIHQCFLNAFVGYGVPVTDEMIRMNRGKDKKEMIASVLDHYMMPSELTPFILESFNNRLVDNLDNFKANEGVIEIIQFLKDKNITIGLGSGFPRDIFDLIFHHLGWEEMGFDYIGTAGEIGRGGHIPI